jgi:hypothetical protein
MPSIDNLDFLNLNSLRNYPIKEGVSRISTDGVFTIPNDLIVDFQLAASYDPTKRFYISKMLNFEDSLTIEIADQANILAGRFFIDISTHTQYKQYYFIPTAAYVAANGVIVINDFGTLLSQPAGIFTFTLARTEFEARTIVPALKGINRLLFENTDGTLYGFSGDVKIIARMNLRFKQGDDANTVIVDAGNGLGLDTLCSEYDACIKTINGISGDEDQNFTLDFSDCATLTPIPANTGLLLQDICCKPCIGCNEIDELTLRLTSVESTLVNLRQYYSELQTLFENYKITVGFPQTMK